MLLLQPPPPAVLNINWNGTYVTNVKNQGGCGSCWAFAAIADIETYFLYTHKTYLDLSEQQVINCIPVFYNYGQGGCGGGDPT